MKLWQKLTIDWPCALGDWLWAVLVMAPARFLDRLTWRLAFRLIVQLAMLYILVRFTADIAALDLTFLFTLDASIYWEVGATLIVLTARGHAGQMVGAALGFIARTARTLASRLPRFGRRARRTRPPVRHSPQRGDDEGARAWIGAFA